MLRGVNRCFASHQWIAGAAVGILCVSGGAAVRAAQINFDNGSGDNKWETPQNWGDNSATGTNDVLPGAADVAVIGSGGLIANLSSAQSVTEAQVGWPNGNG